MVIYQLSFIVDEFLENYRELHEWLTGIGFPKDRKQFKDFRSNTSNTGSASATPVQDVGKVGKTVSDSAMFSDATLTILSNKNNPIVEVRFSNMYPVSLGALEFNQQATDVEYMTVQPDFTYQLYEIISDMTKYYEMHSVQKHPYHIKQEKIVENISLCGIVFHKQGVKK